MNQLQIIGNLTRDAEMKKAQNGDMYLSFSVAVNETKDSTLYVSVRQKQYQDRENKVFPFLTKGKKVFVQGRLSVGTYVSNKDGKTYVDITCWAEKIELCGGGEGQQEETLEQALAGTQKGNVYYPDKTPSQSAAATQDDDTDLPF